MNDVRPRQWKLGHQVAAAALASGATEREAGIEACVSVRTIAYWKEDPAFLDLVGQYEQQIREGAVARIVGKGIATREQRVATLEKRSVEIELILNRMVEELSGNAHHEDRFFSSSMPLDKRLSQFTNFVKLQLNLNNEVARELGQRIERWNISNLPPEDLLRLLKYLEETGQMPEDFTLTAPEVGEDDNDAE